MSAQTDVERFFINFPDAVLPVLPHPARQELISLSQQGREAIVTNLFLMPALLTEHATHTISVNPTASTRFEVRSLPTDSTPVFVTIHTLLTPVPNSRIRVFDATYKELLSAYTQPDLSAFLTAPDSTIYLERKHWANILVPLHIEAQLDKEGDLILLTLHTDGLSHEDLQGAETAFRKVAMRWEEDCFVVVP